MSRSFKSANSPPQNAERPRAPKRSLKAPLIGLGAGAAVLGGFAFVGSGTSCHEGRIVETAGQCRNLVGWEFMHLCNAAFAVSPVNEQLGAVDRAVFLTRRDKADPQVEAISRRAGDPKWRKTFSNDIAEPFRESCSSSRSSSSGSGSSSGGSGGRSTSAGLPSADSGTHAVARGGFGSTGLAFFSHGS